MTEASYQEARKIMQKANYMRGKITAAKGTVAKWTQIEATYRENMQPDKADGAKKMLLGSLKYLDDRRREFAELRFPENNPTSPLPLIK